jgi:hypothetical protein
MKFNKDKLRSSRETPFLVIDFIMLGLVFINLAWLLFDTLFTSKLVRQSLEWFSPAFTEFYAAEIHVNFILYDLAFVAVFLTEFVVRWGLAVRNQTYHRWFFYPFVHWYDLLGCIPVGSFRWLRLLRIISIVYRLQKYQIIDISNLYLVRFVRKYMNVLVEELSDRVVIHVLDGIQDEISVGTPVMEKIVQQVILPNKPLVIEWIASRINDLADNVYQPRRPDLKLYIDGVIASSIAQDQKVAALEKLPVIGQAVTEIIETTVSDIVFNVLDRVVMDIGAEETDVWVRDITDQVIARLLQPSAQLNAAGRDVLIDILDVVKDEVRIQRWKLKEVTP